MQPVARPAGCGRSPPASACIRDHPVVDHQRHCPISTPVSRLDNEYLPWEYRRRPLRQPRERRVVEQVQAQHPRRRGQGAAAARPRASGSRTRVSWRRIDQTNIVFGYRVRERFWPVKCDRKCTCAPESCGGSEVCLTQDCRIGRPMPRGAIGFRRWPRPKRGTRREGTRNVAAGPRRLESRAGRLRPARCDGRRTRDPSGGARRRSRRWRQRKRFGHDGCAGAQHRREQRAGVESALAGGTHHARQHLLGCARQTGGGWPVKVRRKEGVTNHLHPESCAGRREAAGEALTGARMGRAIEHGCGSSS